LSLTGEGEPDGKREVRSRGACVTQEGRTEDLPRQAPRRRGWTFQAEEATRATSVHRTKAEAVAAGKELARSKTPSQLLVYEADGFEVHEEKTYE
jgi:Uncharacterized protein conserved in bacteria (DUF2188)